MTTLDWTAEWLTAFGTVSTAVVAFVAAVFAGWQVLVMRRSRRDETRPYVVVDIVLSREERNTFNLVIENIGRTLATNVRLSFEPELTSTLDNGRRLRSAPMIREGIAFMPPGRRIEALFDQSHERIKANLPLRYEVAVDANDARGKALPTLRYVIDVSYLLEVAPRYETLRMEISDATKAASEALTGIGRAIRELSTPMAIEESIARNSVPLEAGQTEHRLPWHYRLRYRIRRLLHL